MENNILMISKCHTKNRQSRFHLLCLCICFLIFLENTNLLLCSCKYTHFPVKTPGIRRKGKRKSFGLPSLCDDHSFFWKHCSFLTFNFVTWTQASILKNGWNIQDIYMKNLLFFYCLCFTQSPFFLCAPLSFPPVFFWVSSCWTA